MARTVLIVGGKRQQDIALMWFSMIGDVAGQKAIRITEAAYVKEPADKTSTQPTIFLGDLKGTRMMRAGLPQVFYYYGAECRMNKRQAVVTVQWPDHLKEVDAGEAAEKIARETRERYGSDAAASFARKMPVHPGTGRDARRAGPSDGWDQSLNFAKKFLGGDLAVDTKADLETRRAFGKVLHAYTAARFVSEYLTDFTAD